MSKAIPISGTACHHVPIIKKPFQDLAVISAATIKGCTDLQILPLEIELFIAEQVELSILRDEIAPQKDWGKQFLYQYLWLQTLSRADFGKLIEKYHLYKALEYDSCSLDYASENGHLGIARWLYEIGYETTLYGFDCAVKNGHLDTIKWYHQDLHWNKPAAYAFDLAAGNGHLETIKWLQQHGSSGTGNAITYAKIGGHVKIIQWLCQNGYKEPANDNLQWLCKLVKNSFIIFGGISIVIIISNKLLWS